jgi:glycosyltransferase involved in cell wall biosynthesis
MQNKNILSSFDFSQNNLSKSLDEFNESYEKLLNDQGLRTKEQDLLVFSHLRWDFVFQRPQHLLSRFAKDRRVFFIEEPILTEKEFSHYKDEVRENGVRVITPILRKNLKPEEITRSLSDLVDSLILDEKVENYVSWYYTPMALAFTKHLTPSAIIYDCMDELSAFKDAPKDMIQFENDLLKLANVVFTGGQSLYEAKKKRHHNIYPFPSSIDGEHFKKARSAEVEEPEDQKNISHPRLGFFGVIDERMDIELLDKVAEAKPEWQIIMIGPVVKIDPKTLPKRPNIHYLGKKEYKDLPRYLSGWDVALLPFAMNESTKFISPTKTPEYLAAGCPVVSTPIRDVVRPYAEQNLVHVADNHSDFIQCIDKSLELDKEKWIQEVDSFLADMSWDSTFSRMADIVRSAYNSQFKSSLGSFLNSSETATHMGT